MLTPRKIVYFSAPAAGNRTCELRSWARRSTTDLYPRSSIRLGLLQRLQAVYMKKKKIIMQNQ